MKSTWKPDDEEKSSPENRRSLPNSAFAFPAQRKGPMIDASHVRNTIARFNQVKGVTDTDRDQAFANLQTAAKHFQVELNETSWHDHGSRPHTPNKAAKKTTKKSALKM